MKLIDAIEIVMSLATDNILEPHMVEDQFDADERARQLEALATLHDFAVNHLGED